MGGIPTNWKGQVIDFKDNTDSIVKGLWAAGECASSSVHGANRLGANSLLDIVVFGKACAENISEINKPGDKIENIDIHKIKELLDNYSYLFYKKGSVNAADLRLEMQKTMQKHAGVFRNIKSMEEGVEKMQNIYDNFKDVSIDDKSNIFNTDFIELLELRNLLDNAIVTMNSANFRKESRGAHSHDDFKERDDENWLKHTICYLNNNKVKLTTRNVNLFTLNNEVESVPLAKRVY